MAILIALCMTIGLVNMIPIKVHAATGDLMSNPVMAKFGKKYTNTWTRDTDHMNHYVKFSLSEQGIVTVNATKPFDDDQEYARLKFTIYDDFGDPVFDNHTYGMEEDAKSDYTFKVGLDAGSYYLTILPGFHVRSGIIETDYTLSFSPNDHCEIEPNGAGYLATPVAFGEKYIGYYGGAGGDYEEDDYFKFPVVAGQEYRVVWYNYAKMANTSAIVKVVFPDGEDYSIKYDFADHFTADGLSYSDFKATATGTAYLRIYNSNRPAFEYGFVITNNTCAKRGHTYGAWTVTQAAGCGVAGEQTRTCACGAKQTQTIPATAHSFGPWWTATTATCMNTGVNTRQCTFCGAHESQMIPAQAHLFGAWQITVSPTYTAEGLQTHQCSVCGISEEQTVPRLNMTGASDWAVAQIVEGIDAGIVPAGLQNSYTVPITRAEFCALATTLYEKQLGTVTAYAYFTDTSDINVQKMAGLGVVNGVGNNQFSPNSLLTREQAATMLARLVNAMGKPFAAYTSTFADNAKISSWALDAVGQVQAAGVMGGVGNNMFSPETHYTREQSILTMVRILNYVK